MRFALIGDGLFEKAALAAGLGWASCSRATGHFDDATNRELVRRCTAALRTGGLLVLADLVKPKRPRDAGLDTFYDLYFAMISESGLWSPEQMVDWQRAAGLLPRRPVRLIAGQGPMFVIGEKP